MRAVFVNQCHPALPHVCAVRLREFAGAMAGRGHRVVLLTEVLEAGMNGCSADEIQERLAGHDWKTPLHLACARTPAPLLERLHTGRLPYGFRQGVVGASFVLRDGVFSHWRRGSQETAAVLARAFGPDIVWGTFGNTDAWNIARDLARHAGCPWVADMKDNWENFIPFGLRAHLAGRYADAGQFTALSAAHAGIVESRFGRPATVVYSGFPNDVPQIPEGSDGFRILATGSIYDGQALTAIIRGIGAWLGGRSSESPVEFRYFGDDHERVRAIAAALEGRCRIRVEDVIALPALRIEEARASVIVYPRDPPMRYHHKFMEYLSTGRPVLCLPGETEECRTIAREISGPFFSCDSVTDVTDALGAIAAGIYPALDRNRVNEYSWDAQAEVLEGVFRTVIQVSAWRRNTGPQGPEEGHEAP